MPSKTTLAVLILSFLVDTQPSVFNLGLPLLNQFNKSTQKGSEPLLSDTKNSLKLPVKKQQNVKVFSILPEQNQDPNCKRLSRLQRYSKMIYQNPIKLPSTVTAEKKILPVPDVSVSSKTVTKTSTIPNIPVAKPTQSNIQTTKKPQIPTTDQQTNTSYYSPLQKLTLDDISPKNANLKQDPKQVIKKDNKINQPIQNNQKSTPQTQSQFKIVQVSDHGIDSPDTQFEVSGTQQTPQIPEDGSNIVQGDDNQLLGKYNLINGNSNSLVGINNIIRGEANKLVGKSNTIVGFENYAVGNENGIIGVSNEAMGNSNAVIGTKNNVQGNGNTLQTSKSIIRGNNNVIKTSKLL